MAAERDIDIALFGASGFVGRLTAGHLATHAPEGVRIALAGRSLERLREVRDELGVTWPLLAVDAGDRQALTNLARRSRVVATTVGPYVRHGLPLVEACAAAGSHYADLTGEVLFVRESIDRCHEVARRTGAKIVHSCGFDSIPSDLGVLETSRRSAADGAGELTRTTLHVRSLRGGFSGGTIDSLRQQAIMARTDPAARAVIADPYSLVPSPASPEEATAPRGRPGLGRLTHSLPVRRAQDGQWTGPFVMASYNTRVVRRSNALLDGSYGRRFRYAEVTDFGRSPTSPLLAWGASVGLLAVVAGMSFTPTRWVLDRLLPSPGEGPSEQTRARGRFRIEIDASTTSGAHYRTTVAADADPGYDGTAIMLGQAALCLALDDDRLPPLAGVVTPASGLGQPLVERLRAAGFTIATRRT